MHNTRPHAAGLRKGRINESGRIYLITCVTWQRRDVFSEWACGRLLVTVLMSKRNRAGTLAYVVMPDRLHWLVQPCEGTSLDRLMRTVKSVSSHRINTKLNRTGRLWQPGYHDHALRREEDLIATARYVVANPLRAGLVKKTSAIIHCGTLHGCKINRGQKTAPTPLDTPVDAPPFGAIA